MVLAALGALLLFEPQVDALFRAALDICAYRSNLTLGLGLLTCPAPLLALGVGDAVMWAPLYRQWRQTQADSRAAEQGRAQTLQVQAWDREMAAKGFAEGDDEHYI